MPIDLSFATQAATALTETIPLGTDVTGVSLTVEFSDRSDFATIRVTKTATGAGKNVTFSLTATEVDSLKGGRYRIKAGNVVYASGAVHYTVPKASVTPAIDPAVLAAKADQTYVDNALAPKADKSYVDSNFAPAVSGKVPDANLPTRLSDASLKGSYAAPGDLYRLSPKRPAPPVTMVAGTQPGHAISQANASVATSNLNDTSDPMLGTQAVTFVSNTTAETDGFKWTGNLDMTGKGFVFFFKATNQTLGITKIDVQLPSGDGNFTGQVMGGQAYTADQQYAKEGEWIRFFVPFSVCTGTSYKGGTTGTTMARNAITSVRLRFWNAAGQVVTAGFAGFGTYPEPTGTFPNGVISLTYDDSYANQFTNARPALDKYGYRGTLYPIIDRIDSGASYLSSSQIAYLHDRLGWEIGAHASTTAIHGTGLTGLSSAQRQAELKTIRDWQVANGYMDGASFAYPRGAFDPASITDVAKWWDGARTTYAHGIEVVGTPYPYRLRSIIAGGPTLAQMKTMVDCAKQSRAWTVFTFHSIQPTTINDATLDILSSDHAALIDYIASSGVPVLPVGEVLRAAIADDSSLIDGGTP